MIEFDDVRKCSIPEEVILQYELSFVPEGDKILGIMGRYMYIELVAYLPPIGDVEVDSKLNNEEISERVILKISIVEYQKLFKKWIMGKKAICESYGHWCGCFGDIYIDDFEIIGYKPLIRFDKTKNVDDPEYVYYEETPVIKVTKWSDMEPDFEHG